MSNVTFDPNNTLAGGLYALSPREAIQLGIDLCAAVESGFGAGACHGSIWPGNISLADGKILLGPSQKLSVKEMKPDALEYIAPEQFWNGEDSPACDVYSIGLILFTALNGGLMPFFDTPEVSADTRAAALQNRMRGKNLPYPRTASRELGDVVLKALSFHREDRYADASLLRQALLALPDGAAVPAAVPVIPLTGEEVKTTRSYKVDKQFEKTEPDKQAKPKKPKKDLPIKPDEAETITPEDFRKPKRSNKWILPVAVLVAAVIVIILALKSCSNGPGGTAAPTPSPTQSAALAQPTVTPSASTAPTPIPTPTATPEPSPDSTPEPTPEVSKITYQVIIDNVTWEQARQACIDMGGHLATVRSKEELTEVVAAVRESGAKFIWLGAHREDDGVWYYVTGEEMDYFVWDTNEPSSFDSDGTPENCVLLWDSPISGMWCFNDTRNDPISVLPRTYSGKTAYVCQFD